MFFFLSKVLGVLVKPISWIVILMIVSVFIRNARIKRVTAIVTLVLLLIFSNAFLFNQAVKRWEVPAVHVDSLSGVYDFGIVLGGASHHFKKGNRLELTAAGDRIWQTLYLYKEKKIRKILISGGSGVGTAPTEAESARDALIKLGIPGKDILIESESRNTYENAKFSAQIINQAKPGARCILITSALHIPRALGCFRKAGINPDVFPADQLTRSDKQLFVTWVAPSSDIMGNWERLINEWVGYIVYKWQGYCE